MSGAAGILPFEIADELLEFGSQGAAVSLVGTGLGLEGLEAAVTIFVEPLFEGLLGYTPGPSQVVFEGLLRQCGESGAQLSPPQVTTEQIPENSVAEQGFFRTILIVHGRPPWFQ